MFDAISGAAASEQGQIAAGLLTQFDRPLAVLFISKAEDWQFRQKTQYEAIKGLMKSDFHSLADYKMQMDTLMGAGPISQQLAWKLMAKTKIVDLQPKLMTDLLPDPEMGLVGKFMRTLAGFTKLFVTPLEIMSDRNGFETRAEGM